jgi:hypothetical protein
MARVIAEGLEVKELDDAGFQHVTEGKCNVDLPVSAESCR